jgi:hypothetical protein
VPRLPVVWQHQRLQLKRSGSGRAFLVTLPGVEYQPPGPGVFPNGVVRAELEKDRTTEER